ncbi:NAD-dependent epimerase/dehydratase family protein [Ornithinimicrobium sufpigmenti]|uniref:NAD-dependent epimerase/dehydratase family protein n=1 Tax=Ornithinimicrobium sufpigmenti TaxID=2508882 RepID=UPI001035F5AF|nr:MULTISPECIES: NAD-dependent epimerase/dehydratase family protein [unclassified Ornithinimicrobium]
MSSASAPASRRSPTPAPRLALTRAASAFGGALAQELVAAGVQVVGLDARAGRLEGVDWRPGDVAAPSVVAALDDVDVLLHVAFDPDLTHVLEVQPAARRARQIDEVRTLVTAAAAAGVAHLVVVTSTMVFGARRDNPVPLPEDHPGRAAESEGLVADLVAVEEELRALASVHPGLRTTIVRPAALVGPGVDTMITRHFEAPRLLRLRGTEPLWSFCHVADLGTALLAVAQGDSDPPAQVSVAAGGALTQGQVEELSGIRGIDVAEGTAYAAADRLHRLGVVPVPATDLAYVAHPWVSEPGWLTQAGWRPRYDNAACLAVLLDEVSGNRAVMARRVGARDAVGAAAAGAASAAVAAIATAALMRRRRGRGPTGQVR